MEHAYYACTSQNPQSIEGKLTSCSIWLPSHQLLCSVVSIWSVH